MNEEVQRALNSAESILSLLHHRGIVDSELNRADVEEALSLVREALDRIRRDQ